MKTYEEAISELWCNSTEDVPRILDLVDRDDSLIQEVSTNPKTLEIIESMLPFVPLVGTASVICAVLVTGIRIGLSMNELTLNESALMGDTQEGGTH